MYCVHCNDTYLCILLVYCSFCNLRTNLLTKSEVMLLVRILYVSSRCCDVGMPNAWRKLTAMMLCRTVLLPVMWISQFSTWPAGGTCWTLCWWQRLPMRVACLCRLGGQDRDVSENCTRMTVISRRGSVSYWTEDIYIYIMLRYMQHSLYIVIVTLLNQTIVFFVAYISSFLVRLF